MKRVLVILSVVLFSFVFLKLTYAADKIGYVDVGKIFDEYQRTKDFDKELEAKVSAYDKEKEAKIAEIKQLQDKLNILTDKEKEAKQKELEEKVKSAREFAMAKEGGIRQERDDKFKVILEDIEKAVGQYAAGAGYAMVFNSKVLVYNNGANDLTAEVLKMIQDSYKKPAEK